MATTISKKNRQKMQQLDKRDNKKFITILIVSTLALLILMYFVFKNSF